MRALSDQENFLSLIETHHRLLLKVCWAYTSTAHEWVILMSPLVGFCGLIVGLQWLFDRLPETQLILDKVNPWWVASNYLFGVLFLLFGHALVGYLAKRYRGSGWWQRVSDDLSGVSIRRAEQEIQRGPLWTVTCRETSDDRCGQADANSSLCRAATA